MSNSLPHHETLRETFCGFLEKDSCPGARPSLFRAGRTVLLALLLGCGGSDHTVEIPENPTPPPAAPPLSAGADTPASGDSADE